MKWVELLQYLWTTALARTTTVLSSSLLCTWLSEVFLRQSHEQALKSIIPVQLIPPGLKEIKQVELATKYQPLIPEDIKKTTDLYDMPSKEVID